MNARSAALLMVMDYQVDARRGSRRFAFRHAGDAPKISTHRNSTQWWGCTLTVPSFQRVKAF
jgi:hypothetical protein